MTCPFNISVHISDRYFAFPYNRIRPQTDVGGALVLNLIVYVPIEEDVKFVDKSYFTEFRSVLVQRHEWNQSVATIVYWNPIFPITTIGVGETCVFSVLLTDSLFYCRTMVVDSNTPMCPIQILTKSLREYIPIAG